ncbi:MAG: B12-binding domain-containing radical SAM protein [candidate division WOR-3 bacterium]
MKILFVYPQFPVTFWGFKYALKFISKKAASPPLGLLTVAAMLPEDWEKRFIDMNTTRLKDKHIKWADYVFISGMALQRESAKALIERCKKLGVKTVAGGPLFTTEYQSFDDIDHLILGEVEDIMPQFINDLGNGKPLHIYQQKDFPDITKAPIPLWKIVNKRKYSLMSIQYSRGCPFDCEFCSVTALNGHKPRTKTREQIINELNALYNWGWRDAVFFVDDNFIGNKKKLKEEVLPAIIKWMSERRYPFTFSTQCSINLSDDNELMDLMVKAGFQTVFIGIETPNEASLNECGKKGNMGRDLVENIKNIQSHGIEVQAGFILGFDNDPESIFVRLAEFIQNTGISTAMVGLLNAGRGSKLFQRLKSEGRLLKETSGDNTDFSINFVPKMDYKTLINGYKKVLANIYSPKQYYERAKRFLREFNPPRLRPVYFRFIHLKAFFRSIWYLGIVGKERLYFWRLFFWTLVKRPTLFPTAVTISIQGYHFRRVCENRNKFIS